MLPRTGPHPQLQVPHPRDAVSRSSLRAFVPCRFLQFDCARKRYSPGDVPWRCATSMPTRTLATPWHGASTDEGGMPGCEVRRLVQGRNSRAHLELQKTQVLMPRNEQMRTIRGGEGAQRECCMHSASICNASPTTLDWMRNSRYNIQKANRRGKGIRWSNTSRLFRHFALMVTCRRGSIWLRRPRLPFGLARPADVAGVLRCDCADGYNRAGRSVDSVYWLMEAS